MSESSTQLNKGRLFGYDLVKSFFVSSPTQEKMDGWKAVMRKLEEESVNPTLDRSVALFNELIDKMSLAQIQREYYELFENPFGDHLVNTAASAYMDGRNFGPTLVALRGFLVEAGIEKVDSWKESEDSLVVMLDFMITLIEQADSNGKRVVAAQKRLLKDFILPFSHRFYQALSNNNVAVFYEALGLFLLGFMEMEEAILQEAEG